MIAMKALPKALLFAPRSAHRLWPLLALLAAGPPGPAPAPRIQEGAGGGGGDKTTKMPYTTQALSNYLQQMGLSLPPGAAAQLQPKNVAAVIVTAQLPAFAQPGQTMDVNVSSVGNARSLKGGTL